MGSVCFLLSSRFFFFYLFSSLRWFFVHFSIFRLFSVCQWRFLNRSHTAHQWIAKTDDLENELCNVKVCEFSLVGQSRLPRFRGARSFFLDSVPLHNGQESNRERLRQLQQQRV